MTGQDSAEPRTIPLPGGFRPSDESASDLESLSRDARIALAATLAKRLALALFLGGGAFCLRLAEQRLWSVGSTLRQVLFGFLAITAFGSFCWALAALFTLLRGPRSGDSPAATARLFFSETESAEFLWSPAVAWACMTKFAKSGFDSLESFSRAWRAHVYERRRGAEQEIVLDANEQLTFRIREVNVLLLEEPLALVEIKITLGPIYEWDEVRVLARVGGRWYLVDGVPHAEALPELAAVRRSLAKARAAEKLGMCPG